MNTLHLSLFRACCAAALAGSMILAGCSRSETPTTSGPVRVTVQTAAMSPQGGSLVFSGTVESADNSAVSFTVPGTITQIDVREGQRVAKGQVIARVRSADYANASNIASAELAEARDAYARLKKLHDADALPDVKWVEVQQKLKQAENAAEIASRSLSDATLRSPVAGVVNRKLVSVGQNVVPGQPVAEIVALTDLMVSVSVPESEIGRIAEGQSAQVVFDMLDSLKVDGRITRRSVVADPLTRAYNVKISIPASGGRILPGMVSEVTLAAAADTAQASGAVVLPSQAVLLASDNRNFVWVVEGGKAVRRFVTARDLTAGGIAVTSGLQPSDSVIVAGMQKVGTGTPVVATR